MISCLVTGCRQRTSMRSADPNGAPTSGLASIACLECRCMMAPSVATHGSASSRMFQTSDRVPPGTRTRAISGTASAASNQCQAWATTTASTLASPSGIRSAVPASTAAPGTAAASCSRIAREGSTAVTVSPASTSERVSLPVPAPRSSTLLARRGTSHSTADGGYSGRPRWYWSAAAPNDDACSSRDQRLVAPCLVIPHAAPISSQLARCPRRSSPMMSARHVSMAAIAAVSRARPSSPPPPATRRAVSVATSSTLISATGGNIRCFP